MKPKYLKLIRQPSGIYHLQGVLLGQQIRESTRTRDKYEANMLAVHKELQAMMLATGKTEYLSPKFSECVRRYEKDVRYSRKNQGIVNRLDAFFGAKPVTEISQSEVDKFVFEVFIKHKRAKSTIERNLNILQAIRNHAVKAKLVDQKSLPFISVERVSKHQHRMSIVDKNIRDQIINNAAQPVRDVLTFLWYTGSRIGCALNRTWQDRCDTGIKLYTVKGGRNKLRQRREYYVPEVPELTAMLNSRLMEARKSSGFQVTDKIFDVSDTTVREELARVCEVLSIRDFMPHDIRHCFGTYLAQDKVGIEAIADLMGHDSLESTRKYINHARDDLTRQMRGALSKPVSSGGVTISEQNHFRVCR
ncbi:tyrosine-type recombinase/integrase [Endozoicomonas atrinae]|uniref:tyrosine-type recombinase/integrase n=1 Tax=Endozoicomonas atrinae TaxID=1333660 RepID=UPI000826FD6D|nr:tyrosine-type recombinase/integrase [Endozoicomonas atrinae]